MYGMPDFYGSKYTGYRPAAEVAKLIRAELKAAQKAGELPTEIKFSVTSDYFSGGQSVSVEIRGWTDEEVWETYQDAYDMPRKSIRPAAAGVKRKVERIANAYNRDRSDSQVDYFDVMYYCRVEFESDWRRQYRARETAARAAKRAAKVPRAA